MTSYQLKSYDKIFSNYQFPKNKPSDKPNLHGWMGEGNKRLLHKYLNPRMRVVFEFGAWLGLSTKFILENTSRDCLVISIDHWEGGSTINQSGKYSHMINSLYNTFIVNMWEYRNRLIPLRMSGNDAMLFLAKAKIEPDLIYLDMDHEYEPVIKDLRILTKHFPDAIIVGDDIKHHAGVSQAVHEIMRSLPKRRLKVDSNSYAITKKSDDPQSRFLQYKSKDAALLPHTDTKTCLLVLLPNTSHAAKQKEAFLEQIHGVTASKDALHMEIIFIQQRKTDRSNPGKTINAGLQYALQKGFQTIIIHESPTLFPDATTFEYYRCYPKRPIVIGYNAPDFSFYGESYGILSIDRSDIIRINGYPNDFEQLPSSREVINRLIRTRTPVWIPSGGHLSGKLSHILTTDYKRLKQLKQKVNASWGESIQANGFKNLLVDDVNVVHDDSEQVFKKPVIKHTHLVFVLNDFEMYLQPTESLLKTISYREKPTTLVPRITYSDQIVTTLKDNENLLRIIVERNNMMRDNKDDRLMLRSLVDPFNLKPRHITTFTIFAKHIEQMKPESSILYVPHRSIESGIEYIRQHNSTTQKEFIILVARNIMPKTIIDDLPTAPSMHIHEAPSPRDYHPNRHFDLIFSAASTLPRSVIANTGILRLDRAISDTVHTMFHYIKILNMGGTLVMYFNLYHPVYYELIYILSQHFETIKLRKTPMGNFGLGVHVVAVGYSGMSSENMDSFDQVYQDMDTSQVHHSDMDRYGILAEPSGTSQPFVKSILTNHVPPDMLKNIHDFEHAMNIILKNKYEYELKLKRLMSMSNFGKIKDAIIRKQTKIASTTPRVVL